MLQKSRCVVTGRRYNESGERVVVSESVSGANRHSCEWINLQHKIKERKYQFFRFTSIGGGHTTVR